MKDKIQNKWEDWALKLHGENIEFEDNLNINSTEENDKKVVDNIFEVRGKVRQVRFLKSENIAWKELKTQLPPRQLWREFIKYAAVVVISLLIGGSAFWGYNKLNSPIPEYASITAPNGQITNVTLFDGTNIWLNSGSTLKYEHNFNKKSREVYLDGEAYFDVTKNEERPFFVNAKNTRIKVLGTIFNVKAYLDESKVEIVLVEGKVQFIVKDKSIVLKPGEHLVFSEKTNRLTKTKVNITEYIAWKGGKIYFNNETLLELTHQIERWYEVKFQFTEEHIKNYRFTGVINKDKTLDYTLKIIAAINKVDFELNNEQIKVVDKK